MGDFTQALSLDFSEEASGGIAGVSENLWGRLVSLNESCDNFDLRGKEFILGRQSVCGAKFDNKHISGQHCKLSVEIDVHAKIVFLEDLSSNGTWLNGNRVGKGNRMVIRNGDEVTLLPKRDDNSSFISFIYQDYDCSKKEEEEGGPDATYEVRDTLGTGNFASVKLAVHRETGKRYAIKVIDKKRFMKHSAKKESLMAEVNILRNVSHPNIIAIQEIFDTEKILYIVLELVTGGELFDRIVEKGHFTEEECKKYFTQILDALHYLHGKGIAHRDLKPENILFANKKYETVKLSDFGLSRITGDGSFMQTMCGTPQYLAPEIISNTEHKRYDKQVDLWSLGAILYVMLSGTPPFDDTKPMSIFEQIKAGIVDFYAPVWKEISVVAKDLVKCLLTVDPSKRYCTAKTMVHPWLTGKGMKELLEQRKRDEETQKTTRGRAETKVRRRNASEENRR